MAGVDLGAGQHLMGEAMDPTGFQRAVEHVAVPRACVERPGRDQQRLAGSGRRLAPQLEGAAEQGHVVGALVIGEPDDARDAVRRTVGVRDVEALEPEHPLSAARKLPAGGRAHAADPDDDDVIDFAGQVELPHAARGSMLATSGGVGSRASLVVL